MKRCFRAFNTPLLPPYRRYPMPSSYRNVGSERRVQSSLCIAGCTIRHRRLSLHHPFCIYEVLLQTFGNVRTEYLRQHGELVLEYDRLDTRNDGDRNAFRPASVYECVIFFIVEKHLCHQVVRPVLYFLFQIEISDSILGASSCFSG